MQAIHTVDKVLRRQQQESARIFIFHTMMAVHGLIWLLTDD
jgi:hypothetical protein